MLPSRTSTLALTATLLAGVGLAGCGSSSTSSAPSGGSSSTSTSTFDATAHDFAAIRKLMASRAKDVLHHDRAAFLATVDPEQTELVEQQQTLFDNLTQFHLTHLTYAVGDAGLEPAPVPGDDPTLKPEVYEHVQLAGVFSHPITNPVDDTFIRRDGHWLVGAETQTDQLGQYDTPTERPWFGDPVTVHSQGQVTVVVDRSEEEAAEPLRLTVATDITRDAGLLKVAAHQPVLVDATSNGLASVQNTTTDEQAGAVTIPVFSTDPLDTTLEAPAGYVIKVNPDHVEDELAYPPLLRHEVTHLLLHAYSGIAPKWVTEGIAEVVGNYPERTESLQPGTSEFRAVLAGDHTIPVSGNFGQHPASDYAVSESAVRYLVKTYGIERFKDFLDLYRKQADAPLDDGLTPRLLRREYGITLHQLDDATWRTLAQLSAGP